MSRKVGKLTAGWTDIHPTRR